MPIRTPFVSQLRQTRTRLGLEHKAFRLITPSVKTNPLHCCYYPRSIDSLTDLSCSQIKIVILFIYTWVSAADQPFSLNPNRNGKRGLERVVKRVAIWFLSMQTTARFLAKKPRCPRGSRSDFRGVTSTNSCRGMLGNWNPARKKDNTIDLVKLSKSHERWWLMVVMSWIDEEKFTSLTTTIASPWVV